MREIAQTVLLLVAARRRSPQCTRGGSVGSRGALEAREPHAVIETVLPRALVRPARRCRRRSRS
jgi:hypothetical protein